MTEYRAVDADGKVLVRGTPQTETRVTDETVQAELDRRALGAADELLATAAELDESFATEIEERGFADRLAVAALDGAGVHMLVHKSQVQAARREADRA